MEENSFEDFLDALRAFESGWDRPRYEAGIIAEWQLNQWGGGTATEFFPQYSSWGELTDAEWEAMSYRSMNTLGFVGYQFGEALLIDLGYYDDDVFYGNGAASNTWDGTWTGKNGATSLDAFMTAQVQDRALRDAFGHNLQVIENGLAQQGIGLDDVVGTTGSYMANGQVVTVELTLTGILAAAHLRGPWGTLALLQGGAVSTDEFGTSILQYIEQFGGFDSPTIAEFIADWENGKTGDEGLGTPGGGNADPGDGTNGGGDGDTGGDTGEGTGGGTPPPASSLGTANVTEATATVAINWAWGTFETVAFDAATDTIFIAWIGAADLDVSESAAGVVIAVPSNNQAITLAGVTLAELSPSNFTLLDQTAADEVFALIGDQTDNGGNTGDESDGGGTGDGGGMGEHQMVVISLTSPSQTIADFNPAMDMVHIEGGVTAERLTIFEENMGDGPRLSFVVADGSGGTLSQTTLLGVSIADLSMGNFSIAEQSALNAVATLFGTVIDNPGDGGSGGFDLVDDTDGSNPPTITGATDGGGVKYRADPNADDIVGFNAAIDEIDFGDTSVHGLIVSKSPSGEVVIDSPWSEAAQIVQGVSSQDLSIASFGVVGNEHLREDLGGVLSWELGIGPRDSNTVYIRSHEYGRAEVIDDFDPATDAISFLYFGTRERLSVEDTSDGLVISVLPSGQSFTFTGLSLSDLSPGHLEFHFDQVMEDNLEVPFGFDQNDVTLVDRTVILTPESPAGQTTDGGQTREGVFTTGGGTDDGGTDGGPDGGGTDGGPDGGGSSGGGGSEVGDGTQYALTWNWAVQETITGFDPLADTIDFGSLGASHFDIGENASGDLTVEIVGNGGQTYVFSGIGAENIAAETLTAPDWNGAALAAAWDDLATLI